MKTAMAIGAGLAISTLDDIAVVGVSAAWVQTPMPADDIVPANNQNPMLPLKIHVKKAYCTAEGTDNTRRQICQTMFGDQALPARPPLMADPNIVK